MQDAGEGIKEDGEKEALSNCLLIKLNKVIDRIESYKKDCIDMGDLLYK